jgi:uncharacterized protein YpmB
MSPQELSKYLNSMASYLEEAKVPSQRAIVAGIERAMKELQLSRQAGRVTKFVDKDVAQAMQGLDELVEKLSKAAKSVNPQNEAKAALEHAVSNLQKLKAGLSEEVSELSRIDI